MAVAEKQLAAESKTEVSQPNRILMWLVGAVYVLFCLGMVFSGLPMIWDQVLQIPALLNNNMFLSTALLLIVELILIVGLIFLTMRLEPDNPPKGYRAGIFMTIAVIFLAMWMDSLFTSIIRDIRGAGVFALALTLIIYLGLVIRSKWFAEWMEGLDASGWFHATGYKPNQGLKVRRGTIIGAMVIGIAGIITLMESRSFGSEAAGPNNWEWVVPFTNGEYYIPIMFNIHLTLPLVLFLLLGWFSWRIVNFPGFTDFLIATEAEMNKVSWASRKRLVQDTVVVLATMFFMAVFLFCVDFFWIKGLSAINVLRVDLQEAQQQQQEKTPW